ncbi:uncharacterized protein LOC121392632 [Gigantopelta aegis]|uniref:uncharacterized protein LOC121392632 n=1 Tax=Gigantopelta aegis TaxID=1735272 RepID=UPI001B88E66C|nr:uncharacterized protein LOC121392632 [Gigantopelta aegis]
MKLALFLVLLSAVLKISDSAGIETGAVIKDKIVCTSDSPDFIAHPTRCELYYDCANSKPHGTSMASWETYEAVCSSYKDQLFNNDTKRCEHYSMVECGNRFEPIYRCDYRLEGYPRIPCNVYNPSCKGRPDGLNPWVPRYESPYFVVCKSNRTVYQGMCYFYNGYAFIFDVKLRTCVIYMG